MNMNTNTQLIKDLKFYYDSINDLSKNILNIDNDYDNEKIFHIYFPIIDTIIKEFNKTRKIFHLKIINKKKRNIINIMLNDIQDINHDDHVQPKIPMYTLCIIFRSFINLYLKKLQFVTFNKHKICNICFDKSNSFYIPVCFYDHMFCSNCKPHIDICPFCKHKL